MLGAAAKAFPVLRRSCSDAALPQKQSFVPALRKILVRGIERRL